MGAPGRPQPWHYTALQDALAGAEPAQIAEKLKKPLGTIKRLLNGEWAQTQAQRWHEVVMASTAKDRADPIKRFQALVDRAIAKVEQKMDCGDDKVELLAAQRILDNAGLSVVKRVEVSEDQQLRDLTPAQLAYVARTGQLPASRAVVALEALNGKD